MLMFKCKHLQIRSLFIGHVTTTIWSYDQVNDGRGVSNERQVNDASRVSRQVAGPRSRCSRADHASDSRRSWSAPLRARRGMQTVAHAVHAVLSPPGRLVASIPCAALASLHERLVTTPGAITRRATPITHQHERAPHIQRAARFNTNFFV